MYVYGTRLRPPDIGCVPKDGLQSVMFTEFEDSGRHYWGKAFYNRKLTDEETEHYDLDCIKIMFTDDETED